MAKQVDVDVAEPSDDQIAEWERQYGPVVQLTYDESGDEFMPESCKRTVYFKKISRRINERFLATVIKKSELMGVATLRALEDCALHPAWPELKAMYDESPGLSTQHYSALSSASGFTASFTARRASKRG